MASKRGIYDESRLYDIAFSYRDFKKETKTLLHWFQRYSSLKTISAPRSALELAAGPARHALALAKIGVDVTCLDQSARMCNYAKLLARRAGTALRAIEDDMVHFELGERFDLVLNMLDSTSHILTVRDLRKHFTQVARHMSRGGVYILELAKHSGPGKPSLTRNRWEAKRRGTLVRIDWGSKHDWTVGRVTHTAVSIVATSETRTIKIKTTIPLRHWKAKEVESAIAHSGQLQVVAAFGDFDPDVDPSHPRAWRLIYVLRVAH